MKIPISVPIDRCWHPISVGTKRHVNALYNQRRDRYGAEEIDGWGAHINGAIAEAEVAHHLGVPWNASVGRPGAPDIVPGVEVRSTTLRDGCLILHPPDVDSSRFILVVGELPNLHIVGWQRKADIVDLNRYRVVRGWNQQRTAFFVPQSQLRPMDEFEL